MSQELLDYVKKSKQSGMSDNEIRQSLIKSGWREEDIDLSFGKIGTKKKVNRYLLGIIGFFSGVISSFYFELDVIIDSTFLELILSPEGMAPGIVFGFFLAVYFLFLESISLTLIIRALALIIISTLAFFASVLISIPGSNFGFGTGFIGGLIGGAILLSGLSYLFYRSNIRYFSFISIISGVLGTSLWLSLYEIPLFGFLSENFQFSALFIIWQTGVAFSIGAVIDKNSSKKGYAVGRPWYLVLAALFYLLAIAITISVVFQVSERAYYQHERQKAVDIRKEVSVTGDAYRCFDMLEIKTKSDQESFSSQIDSCIRDAAVTARDPDLCNIMGSGDFCKKEYERRTGEIVPSLHEDNITIDNSTLGSNPKRKDSAPGAYTWLYTTSDESQTCRKICADAGSEIAVGQCYDKNLDTCTVAKGDTCFDLGGPGANNPDILLGPKFTNPFACCCEGKDFGICRSTDGVDPFVKGTTKSAGPTIRDDRCVSDNVLQEYSCDSFAQVVSFNIDCAGGCQDGRCLD